MTKKATIDDIPIIRALAISSWNSHYPGIISQAQIEYMLDLMYSENVLRDHFANPNFRYYLLGNEGEYFGIMGYEYHYKPQSTKLHRIYIVEEGKGKGLGKEALDLLKKNVGKKGDQRIILNVNKKNPSYNFYLSQGYAVYEEVVLDVGEGFVMDDYLMEFLL